jgi:metal-dependent HD superfamily phosphatase/phosphodiesterase
VLKKLDDELAAAGRSRDGFEIVVTPISTTAEDLAGFKALGVDRLVVQLGSQKPERVAQRMEELAGMVAAAA